MYQRRLSTVQAAAVALPDVAPARAITTRTGVLWIAVALAHVPLALAMQAQSILAYFHGALVFAAGLWWAYSGRYPHRVAYVCAYVTGSEVMWRMITDALPWEGAKYMVLVLSLLTLVSTWGLKSAVVPSLMFGLLLPSAVYTINAGDYAFWRGELSFNLSGPLALSLCAGLFYQLRLSPERTLRLFLMLLLPSIGIASLVLNSIVTAKAIAFGMGSNYALSGGFGPNQVSLALGLGALAGLWCVLEGGTPWPLRLTLFIITMWLAGQSALTFSRGGLFGAIGAALFAVAFLLRDPRIRKQLLAIVALIVALSMFIIMPFLLDFTGGKLGARFQDTSTTGRDRYGRQDLNTWEENPVLGVGPGLSSRGHSHGAVTHTEFTRLVAEHGSFGAFAMFMMGVFFLRNIMRAPTPREQALAASTMIWSLLYMTNAAMRTVAPAFMFGVGFCMFEPKHLPLSHVRTAGRNASRAVRSASERLRAHGTVRSRREPSVQPS